MPNVRVMLGWATHVKNVRGPFEDGASAEEEDEDDDDMDGSDVLRANNDESDVSDSQRQAGRRYDR